MSRLYSSDGQVVRASASRAVDSGLIPSRVRAMTVKLAFIASLPDVQHQRDSVENKPARLLVVPLEKALNRIPPVDRWSATPKRARYSALIAFSW